MGRIEGVSGLVLEGDIPCSPARGITLANGATVGTPEGITYTVKEQPDTPWAVYRATRDPDWLTMPEPEDDEIYLLMQIFGGSELLGLKVTGCDYTVSVGNVENGVFISSRSTDVTAGSVYEDEILLSESFTEQHQVMIKVTKKENAAGNITKFQIAPHSSHTNPNFCAWNIVEIWAKVPSATVFCISDSSDMQKRLQRLKYLRLAGTNSLTSVSDTSRQLQSITAVLEFDTSSVTGSGFSYFFRDCPRLLAMPPVKIGRSVNMASAFNNCGIKKLEFIGGANVYKAYSSTFAYTNALEEIDFDTSGIVNDFEISKAYGLKSFTMDTTSLAGTASFTDLYSLRRLIFKTEGNIPMAITISNCGLAYNALLETLASIPQAQSASTLTLTNTRGAAELTADDIAAMTAKNWTIVI